MTMPCEPDTKKLRAATNLTFSNEQMIRDAPKPVSSTQERMSSVTTIWI
jgi:hypothetical protein